MQAKAAGVRAWLKDVPPPLQSLMFFVYIVRCADDTLYTGFARDPHERVKVHNSGKGAKYALASAGVAGLRRGV